MRRNSKFGLVVPWAIFGLILAGGNSGAQVRIKNSVKSCGYDSAIESEVTKPDSLLSKVYNSSEQDTLQINKECLHQGMLSKYWKDRHRECASNNVDIESCSMDRPSENYVHTVERSMATALFCLRNMFALENMEEGVSEGILKRRLNLPKSSKGGKATKWSEGHGLKAELMFHMLKVESGFHIGVQSGTGALGTGQLTKDARTQIGSELSGKKGEEILSELELAGHSVCKDLAKHLRQPENLMKPANRCDPISVARSSPLLNLIYSIANVASNERQIRNYIKESSKKPGGTKLTQVMDGLSAAEKEKFVFSLAVWAHNTGTGGMIDSLKKFESNRLLTPDACGRKQQTAAATKFESIAAFLAWEEESKHYQQQENRAKRPSDMPSEFNNSICTIGQALGAKHLFENAHIPGREMRYKEVMEYMPKILDSNALSQNQNCIRFNSDEMKPQRPQKMIGAK